MLSTSDMTDKMQFVDYMFIVFVVVLQWLLHFDKITGFSSQTRTIITRDLIVFVCFLGLKGISLCFILLMGGPNDGDVVWFFHLFSPLFKTLVQTEKYQQLVSRL